MVEAFLTRCMQRIFFIIFGSVFHRSRMHGWCYLGSGHHLRNICMKLFLTWAIGSGSGVHFIRFNIFSSCGNNNLVDGIIKIICAK